MIKTQTYKHNKVARRYNKELQGPKHPRAIVAGGAVLGSALGSAVAFRASVHAHRGHTALGGAIGGAAGGALAAKSAMNLSSHVRRFHTQYHNSPAPIKSYRRGGHV